MRASSVRYRAEAARWAISAVFLVCGTGTGLWAVHIPLVRDRLQLNEQVLGLVLLTFAAGAIFSMPLAGMGGERIGSRGATIIAGLAFVIAFPLPIFAPTLPTLFAAAFAFGASSGALDVSMNAHASEVEAARARPTMSSFHGFFSLGGLVGAVLGGLMVEVGLGDGRGAAAFGFASLLGLMLAASWLLPGAPMSQSVPLSWPRRPALLLGLLAFLCMVIEGAVADWSALLLVQHAGATPASAAIGYSAFSVAMAACRFAGDGIVHTIGARWMMRGGGLSIAVGIIVASAWPWPPAAALGFALVGLGAANVIPVIFAAAGRVPGVSTSAGVATAATIGYAGFLLGPPVIGWLAGQVGLAGALGLLSIAGILIGLGAGATEPNTPHP